MEISKQETKDEGGARSRLIEVSRKLFAEHGLDGTSTRDIAKATGLNISLISYYFGGKEGLYKAVLAEFAEETYSRMMPLLDSLDVENITKESFKKAMRSFLQGLIPYKFAMPEISVLLNREIMAGMPHARDLCDNVFGVIVDRVVAIYKAAQAQGLVRKEIHPHVLFLSMVHSTDMYMNLGNCGVRIAGQVPKLPEEMDQYIEQIYFIFVEGVLL